MQSIYFSNEPKVLWYDVVKSMNEKNSGLFLFSRIFFFIMTRKIVTGQVESYYWRDATVKDLLRSEILLKRTVQKNKWVFLNAPLASISFFCSAYILKNVFHINIEQAPETSNKSSRVLLINNIQSLMLNKWSHDSTYFVIRDFV